MQDSQGGIELLQGIVRGSPVAFEQFYDKYITFVLKIAIHMVKNKQEAEDICHDVFMEVFQKAEQYNATKGSVEAWLGVKTKSRALDQLRKKKPLLIDKLEQIVDGEETNAEVFVLSRLEREMVLEALKHIPKEQRDVIYGSYFLGKSHHEIATAMNRPLGTVKSMIRYGLNNLRKQKAILHWEQTAGGENHEV